MTANGMHLVVPNNKLQDVKQLLHGVSLLHNYLLGPMCQHRVSILHTHRHGWGENLQSLSHNTACLNCMCLQQTVENCDKHTFMFLYSIQHSHINITSSSSLRVWKDVQAAGTCFSITVAF